MSRGTPAYDRERGEERLSVISHRTDLSDARRADAVQETMRRESRPVGARRRWIAYAQSVALVALCTILCHELAPVMTGANIVMLFLLAVAVTAVTAGRGPSILASVLSVAAFDFFFVPPHHTFAVADTQYFVTFGVMLVVALALSTMAARLKEQAVHARRREARTAALYRLSRELASYVERREMLNVAAEMVGELSGTFALVCLADAEGSVTECVGANAGAQLTTAERAAAQLAFDQRHPTGWGTPIAPETPRLFVPLLTGRSRYGVLAVAPWTDSADASPERILDLQAFANVIAVALERGRLADEAAAARVQAETERSRSALLSSVSHDLRTPLAVITGAATSLLDASTPLEEEAQVELLRTIASEASRLGRLVANLLEMTKLEASSALRREWHSVEELIGAALARFEGDIEDRHVTVNLAPDVPLVLLDDVLVTQALVHLIENVLCHTPPRTPFDVAARREDGGMVIEVADRGPGLPVGEERRLFEKFFRGAPARGASRDGRSDATGAGLGLAICGAIVAAHGGRIEAANRPGGGAIFRLWLPLSEEPPVVEREVEPTGAEEQVP
jgi:two-component system sensor histidine kinase KdpD